MKIKLINFPYDGHDMGEIVDYGEEKNLSLISLQRAVLIEDKPFSIFPTTSPKISKSTKKTEVVAEPTIVEEVAPVVKPVETSKKIIENDLKEIIQQSKATTPKQKLSIWDRLK